MEQLVLKLAPPAEPTLDNFLPGQNAGALAALRSILAGSERVAYLWGESGSGKSHLLRALTAAARDMEITSQYMDRNSDNSLPITARLLCADDADEWLAPRQEALFNRFNSARLDGGMIVASGRVPPADLALRTDLRSRIASGIVLQLHPLSDAEKRAAIEANAHGRGFDLKREIIDYLLAHHARDMRSLSSIVAALDEYSLRTQRAVTLPLVRDALKQSAR